jgi:hypothetical protein
LCCHTRLSICVPPSLFYLMAQTRPTTSHSSVPKILRNTPLVEFSCKKRALVFFLHVTINELTGYHSYLIADYDRSDFTLSPCVWASTFNPSINAIYPPGSNSTIYPSGSNSTYNNSAVTTASRPPTPIGGIVGGVIGGLLIAIIAVLLYWHFIWKPRHRAQTLTREDATTEILYEKPELAAGLEHEIVQIAGQPVTGSEMDAQPPVPGELHSSPMYEMPAREPVGNEMHSPGLDEDLRSRSRRSSASVSRRFFKIARKEVGLSPVHDAGRD